MNFKTIRITILVLILAYVGFDTFWSNQRATDWKRSLRVVIYPINADGSDAASDYISQLDESIYDVINDRLVKLGQNYGKDFSIPVSIKLAPQISSQPPKLPETRSSLSVIWWSIKLRYWAWKEDNYLGAKPQIRSYALFYDPKTHKALKHSTGLKKAKIAINHLFADKQYNGQNNVVIMHELFHTLGATDKYDLQSGIPVYPEGYADPKQNPLHPQTLAEIMGGQIALSQTEFTMPDSLAKVVIGNKTAKEIGWID
ncbi:hypothetical protein OO007_07690 [Cocleimonas sp. KMM 6892]|uniref:hypothetical protein n=1 Tax=unclassified Cocleimonas TaxID=2639732 RepID=UPI002DBF97C5|nr:MULTISPECIES: hypothetical protein [unclassified Cocleimonas]MEB8432106.1 hypothetical protein [Cocleimonas sp. KMM 6892]MEC4714808.1 hypothetical protein [Cocleimonas sp. KMM 6895]MEC4744378.1 hypothetical protein [Cocleimonas sp. KMM 6896]